MGCCCPRVPGVSVKPARHRRIRRHQPERPRLAAQQTHYLHDSHSREPASRQVRARGDEGQARRPQDPPRLAGRPAEERGGPVQGPGRVLGDQRARPDERDLPLRGQGPARGGQGRRSGRGRSILARRAVRGARGVQRRRGRANRNSPACPPRPPGGRRDGLRTAAPHQRDTLINRSAKSAAQGSPDRQRDHSHKDRDAPTARGSGPDTVDPPNR